MNISLPTTFDYYDYLLYDALYPELEIYSIEPSIDFINVTIPFKVLNSMEIEQFINNNFVTINRSYNPIHQVHVYETNVPVT